jgi:hypothetical protein
MQLRCSSRTRRRITRDTPQYATSSCSDGQDGGKRDSEDEFKLDAAAVAGEEAVERNEARRVKSPGCCRANTKYPHNTSLINLEIRGQEHLALSSKTLLKWPATFEKNA